MKRIRAFAGIGATVALFVLAPFHAHGEDADESAVIARSEEFFSQLTGLLTSGLWSASYWEAQDGKPGETSTVAGSCVTAERLAELPRAFSSGFRDMPPEWNCSFDRFDVGEGTFSSHFRCEKPGSATDFFLNGTFSPDSLELNGKEIETYQDRSVTSEDRLQMTRTGDC